MWHPSFTNLLFFQKNVYYQFIVSVHAHIVISTELSFRPKGEILNAHDCDILCVSAHKLEQ